LNNNNGKRMELTIRYQMYMSSVYDTI